MTALACIAASAALAAIYARGGAGWVLGFVFLVPWLLALDVLAAQRRLAATLLCAWAMSVGFSAAVFAWFGAALGRYTQVGEAAGVALLLLAAPLFQPQFLAFALARYFGARLFGPALRVGAAAAAWLAAEWLLPRVLGDTLGYGLYPSRLMRQAADLGGTAGLTLLLLLANECVALGLARRRQGWRAAAGPLAAAGLLPLLLAGYGWHVLGDGAEPSPGKPLRMALVQANMVDYEGQRRQKGAYALVREVLDRHFAMSYDAVARQRAEALLWSETAYPTTFGNPKSAAGAEFDGEIRAFAAAAGVPLVFGTYERDGAGEYNAAAFLQPGGGLTALYRKTRLFPFTEYLPAWLEGPLARRLLPWAGSWSPGNGARVVPLRLADGREIPVLPLICRDDVDTSLGIAGARLGAQVIVAMSNDSWFSESGPGAYLHQAAAAFRSIETRLPQFRVTSNGNSAAFDASGEILASAGVGQAALVIADVPVRQPAPTLLVRWGDWVGAASAVFLLVLAAHTVLRRAGARTGAQAPSAPQLADASADAATTVRATPGAAKSGAATADTAAAREATAAAPAPDAAAPAGAGGARGQRGAMAFALPARVYLLPRGARLAAGLARGLARAGLLGMGVALLLDDALRVNTLAQLRMFAGFFLLPEGIAWCILLAYAAQATAEEGRLVLRRGAQRLELPLHQVSAMEAWRLPLPGPGVALRLATGARWRYGLAVAVPARLMQALSDAGGPALRQDPRTLLDVYAQSRTALGRWRLDQPSLKFLLLPLALALPAFLLHQRIAYGSVAGEYYSYGLRAYLGAFAMWWAAWIIAIALGAALLRAAIEGVTLLAAALQPGRARRIRGGLENAAHIALYLGLPAWLLLRIFGG